MGKVSIKSSYGTYFFDVTFKESHSFQNVITQNPVQEGASIDDHVYQQPITFMWDVGVSDCFASANSGVPSSPSHSSSAFTILKMLWETADTLTITTTFQQYKNMVLKSFIAIRDKATMSAMRATVIFQQIIVTSAVEISVSQKISSYPQTTGKTDIGNKGLGGGGFKGGGGGFGSGSGGVR